MRDDYDHILMVRDLTGCSVQETLEAPEGYRWNTYRPGYETYWNEVQHAVFEDKPRDFRTKYIESDYTVFLPSQFFFVFEESTGKPVGVNAAQILRRPDGYLANMDYLGVKNEHCGEGLGRLLLRLAELRFRENGFSTAGLRVADVLSRESARGLYREMGWEAVDRGEPETMFEQQEVYLETPIHPLEVVEEERTKE